MNDNTIALLEKTLALAKEGRLKAVLIGAIYEETGKEIVHTADEGNISPLLQRYFDSAADDYFDTRTLPR